MLQGSHTTASKVNWPSYDQSTCYQRQRLSVLCSIYIYDIISCTACIVILFNTHSHVGPTNSFSIWNEFCAAEHSQAVSSTSVERWYGNSENYKLGAAPCKCQFGFASEDRPWWSRALTFITALCAGTSLFARHHRRSFTKTLRLGWSWHIRSRTNPVFIRLFYLLFLSTTTNVMHGWFWS